MKSICLRTVTPEATKQHYLQFLTTLFLLSFLARNVYIHVGAL